MKLDFRALAEEAFQASGNFISTEDALSEELVGLRLYDAPIFGVADAGDSMFAALRSREAVGPQFRLPEEWLPGARRVISFFLPFSEAVKHSNEADRAAPSRQWLHGRIQGQSYLVSFARRLCAVLEAEGAQAMAPVTGKEFVSVTSPEQGLKRFGYEASFTSNWSERHVAYVCGLGTFGLSKGLITAKGIAGRFCSVVTTGELPVTPRPYTGLYDYCIRCGACARNCPADAITLAEGKRHPPCSDYVDLSLERYRPYYGCGKCQVKVPCRDRIPGRRAVL